MFRELEELELEDLEAESMYEDYEDFEDFEDLEDYEDLENYEDYEADPFLGSWARKAVRGIKKVASGPVGGILKGLAKKAATVAGGAIAGPAGAKIASMIANRAIRESEYESEFEEEGEFEAEFEAAGGDPTVLAEMEYLANLAAEAPTDQEADHFIGAIANLAGNLLPGLVGEMEDYEDYEDYERDEFLPALIPLATSLLPKAIPFIKKGIQAIGKVMARSPRTRKTVKALPRIAAKTVTSLARQAETGRPITKQRIAATVAQQASKTLASKPKLAAAMKPTVAAAAQARRNGSAIAARKMAQRAAYGPVAGIGVPRMGVSRRRRLIRPRYCVY
jgi:hypothetical protein